MIDERDPFLIVVNVSEGRIVVLRKDPHVFLGGIADEFPQRLRTGKSHHDIRVVIQIVGKVLIELSPACGADIVETGIEAHTDLFFQLIDIRVVIVKRTPAASGNIDKFIDAYPVDRFLSG